MVREHSVGLVNVKTGPYNCSSTWNEICTRKPQDEWCKMVPGIHSALCCLLMIDYLHYTEFANQGYMGDLCVFCRSQIGQKPSVFESFHLDILATSFAIGFFHQGIKGKRFQMNLCKIASAATIYHIWLQRKTMNPNRNVQIEGIFQAIKDDVRRRVGFFF